MPSVAEIAVHSHPDGFEPRDLSKDTDWIKHLNTPTEPFVVHIGTRYEFVFKSWTHNGTGKPTIGFNSMQNGLYIWTEKNWQEGRYHYHKVIVEPRFWNASEKDPDPYAEAILRVSFSFDGTISRTMRDCRLHFLVEPAAQAVEAPGSIVVDETSATFSGTLENVWAKSGTATPSIGGITLDVNTSSDVDLSGTHGTPDIKLPGIAEQFIDKMSEVDEGIADATAQKIIEAIEDSLLADSEIPPIIKNIESELADLKDTLERAALHIDPEVDSD